MLSDELKNSELISSREVVVSFNHVIKQYTLYKTDQGRFLGLFNYKRKGQYLGTINANDDLSFEICRGESVAFFGRNGAGKSTALKIITGITKPTSGVVVVKGKVSALLELTAGFDSQLTGRENIYLRGQVMGMSKKEISEIEDEVFEFAELGLYADQPIKSYSSGMKSRLGFAFAVAVKPEILVVDEALSVGDKAFQNKCLEKIEEIISDKNVTVLFVTHSANTAKRFCRRGLVIDKGKLYFDGVIEEAIDYYNNEFIKG